MLEVLFAVTGESIAVFEGDELADASVKGLKQRLGQKLGVPRFRLRLLQDNCPLDDNLTLIDDQTLTHQVVQLVILEFLPPDREQDKSIIVACAAHDDKLLEQHLNPLVTPLCAASFNGSLKCVSLLIEAGANKDCTADNGTPPLVIAAHQGHLEVVRFLVESGANKDQGTTNAGTNGTTPLFIAAHNGHLEVRFLVESGANKDQGTTDEGATPLYVAAQNGHWSFPLSAWVWCQQRPRHHKCWNNASLYSSSLWSPWSCPISAWVWCQQRPRHHRRRSNASIHSSSEWSPRSCPNRTTSRWPFWAARSDCWSSRVPTKTKARQMMEQRLFS